MKIEKQEKITDTNKVEKELANDLEDRNLLLDEYDKEQVRDKNIDFKTLFIVLLCMFISLCIVLPGVYIKNEIYYISRDISKLDEQRIVLLEERRALQRKIEAIYFKNQVLDDFLFEDE